MHAYIQLHAYTHLFFMLLLLRAQFVAHRRERVLRLIQPFCRIKAQIEAHSTHHSAQSASDEVVEKG